MSALVLVKDGVKLGVAIRKAMDPGRSRALDKAVTEHILEEIPRIVRLLQERINEVNASGCTWEDVKIISEQVFDAQRRTIDQDKRRRLSNVLINGFCAPAWDKATHRLMVRLTAELEEEHVERLQRAATRTFQGFVGRQRPRLGVGVIIDDDPALQHLPQNERGQIYMERKAVGRGIERELIARGLMDEVTQEIPRLASREETNKKIKPTPRTELVPRISALGRRFLDYLKDPEQPSEVAASAPPARPRV